MATTQKKTIGIQLPIEAQATGAVSNFHKITGFYFDLGSRMAQVTMMSYVSQAAAAAGKQPLGNVAVTVNLTATEEPAEQLLYQKIVSAPGGDPANPAMQNVFSGATLVTE